VPVPRFTFARIFVPVEDGQALAALCDCHVSATRAACQSRDHLLDFEEYRDAGVGL